MVLVYFIMYLLPYSFYFPEELQDKMFVTKIRSVLSFLSRSQPRIRSIISNKRDSWKQTRKK